MFLFSLGLIKKVVLADAFSKAADFGFSNIGSLSTIEAWCLASAYALQLYFDFSGYSDMAIASALLLGIEVPRNFDAPPASAVHYRILAALAHFAFFFYYNLPIHADSPLLSARYSSHRRHCDSACHDVCRPDGNDPPGLSSSSALFMGAWLVINQLLGKRKRCRCRQIGFAGC